MQQGPDESSIRQLNKGEEANSLLFFLQPVCHSRRSPDSPGPECLPANMQLLGCILLSWLICNQEVAYGREPN